MSVTIVPPAARGSVVHYCSAIKGWAAAVMLGADEAKHLQAVWSPHGDVLTTDGQLIEESTGFDKYDKARVAQDREGEIVKGVHITPASTRFGR